jgi:hypothetical protein
MKKKSVGLLELETAVLECFLEKTPLSPLGVKGTNLTLLFSKNTPKLPFLTEEAQMNFFNFFFALSTIRSCPRLLGEHVQNISQKLTTRIVI